MADINPAPTSHARQPRGAVRLNGTVATGWTDIEVENNAFRAADTFRVSFAVSDLPKGYGPDWFAAQTSIDCEVFATDAPADPDAYAPTDADRLILGQVDDIDYDPAQRSITLTGRDWTAKLIDTKTSENFQNKTASEIATILAGRHGLTPVVTATTVKVGTYYTQNHMSLTQERSEWDILAELALFEGFDVFVTGKELHFQPKPKASDRRYAITWRDPTTDEPVPESNAIRLLLGRSLTIAKGVVVTVRSWHLPSGKAFEASWPKAAKATKPGQSGEAGPLVYHYTIPGKTQDEALQEARRRYGEITKHMVKLNADLPGDALLNCACVVQVRGTGTSWDQDYYPDAVTRSLSVYEGFRMSVTAKNVSADLEDQN